MKAKKKDKFVYLVHCNPEPIVYGVYEKKQDAVRYAISLIRYRRDRAKQHNHPFGYYHFHPLPQRSTLKWMKDPSAPSYYDLDVFTACLKIDDKSEFTDNGCKIKVVRKVLN